MSEDLLDTDQYGKASVESGQGYTAMPDPREMQERADEHANAEHAAQRMDTEIAEPGTGVNCPARPQVVAAFIRAEEKFGTPPETIVLILSAIQLLHDRHGLASPIASAVVRAELERVLKTEAPRSWPRAEQLMFASLPPEIRAVGC